MSDLYQVLFYPGLVYPKPSLFMPRNIQDFCTVNKSCDQPSQVSRGARLDQAPSQPSSHGLSKMADTATFLAVPAILERPGERGWLFPFFDRWLKKMKSNSLCEVCLILQPL